MIEITSYFVSAISVIGTVLAVMPLKTFDRTKIIFNILKEHNKYRKLHGADPLNMDCTEMGKFAVQEVEALISNEPSNTPKKYGVNRISTDVDGVFDWNPWLPYRVVKEDWYDKSAGYDYSNEPSLYTADPFTQLVWKETKKICVYIKLVEKILHIAVIYFPAGNKVNEYVANVGRRQDNSIEQSTN